MSLKIQPLPGFTLFALPLFAALIALGVWQLDRLHWKLALIAEMNTNMHAPAIPIRQALLLPPASREYRRVALQGRFLNAKEALVFAANRQGEAVYHVVTPMQFDDGAIYLVDRGIVPPSLRNPSARASGEMEGEQHVTGIVRTPDPPGPFTPQPDLAQRVWYARDTKSIAASDHIGLASPVIVEADATPNPGGWPKGGQTVVDLPNNHLQYAITWFLMAAALFVFYFVFHRARGRLSF